MKSNLSSIIAPPLASSVEITIDSILADNFLFGDMVTDSSDVTSATAASSETREIPISLSAIDDTLTNTTTISFETAAPQNDSASADVQVTSLTSLQTNGPLTNSLVPAALHPMMLQPTTVAGALALDATSAFTTTPLEVNATGFVETSISANVGHGNLPMPGGNDAIATAGAMASQAPSIANQAASGVLGPVSVAAGVGGASPFVINVVYDANVANAPAGFTAVINSVVQYFESLFNDAVTVNINVGYGTVNGNPLGAGALGQSLTFLNKYTYDQIKTAWTTDSKSADDLTAVATLPAISPVNGAFWMSSAEAKAVGLRGASTSLDGYVGFGSGNLFDFDISNGVAAGLYDFFGVVAHEFTEIMGRMLLVGGTIGSTSNSYYPLDLFHYSAAGVRDFVGTQPGYFSFDNGVTNLNNFNTNSGGDFGDWASSVGNDSFLAFSSSGVVNPVSTNDVREMDILGWDRAPPVLPDLTASGFSFNGTSASFQINNFGLGTAQSSNAGVYLSADSVITAADILLATTATPSLITQASANQSAALTLPSNLTAGTYYLGALADYNGQIAESSESNNGSNTVPVILGNTSNNSLTGTAGNDMMFGFDGNDTLNGGAGADTMYGGNGNDAYGVDNTGDQVIESANQGTDTVVSSISYSLPSNVENLTLAGPAAINATGNSLNNVITGNSGNNKLTGGAGSDHFGFNTALNGSSNVDTIMDFSHAAGDKIDLARTVFTTMTKVAPGTAIISGEFAANASGSARDASDHILYNTTTGALFYDPDGTGNATAIQFAIVANHPTLVASDFLLV